MFTSCKIALFSTKFFFSKNFSNQDEDSQGVPKKLPKIYQKPGEDATSRKKNACYKGSCENRVS
jgi:hypothetical protein